MKIAITVGLLFLVVQNILAQDVSPRPDYENVNITLTGKITDGLTDKPIPGAVVRVAAANTGTPAVATDNYYSTIKITAQDGSFEILHIPFNSQYNVTITAIGYGTGMRTINFNEPGEEETGRKSIITKALGTISLLPEANNLKSVVVTSTARPALQFGIDRKIFDVEKNITSKGGTAVDVMKNIPSLTVDVEGNVQMRNSSPQILIDGRPTILTLDQIPADDIERIELLTNPSAKYDASSAGGIINIVLKQNKRKGFNGIASVGAGTPGVLNGNISLNVRQKSFNVFGSANYNQSDGTTNERAYRINKDNGIVTDYFTQNSSNKRHRKFYSIRVGADYFIDSKTTLSFTQGFHNGRFSNHEDQDQQYFDSLQQLDYTGLRYTDGTGNFSRSSSRLSFDKTFKSPDQKLTADVTYNKGTRGSGSDIFNNYYSPDGSIYQPQSHVRNDGSGNDDQLTVQADYSNKINESRRVEFGLRSFTSNTTTRFGTYAVDNAVETKLPLSSNYKYKETVNAGYFNYADKWKSFQYQLGLRMEFSKLDGHLMDSALSFGYKYPEDLKHFWDALFPSIFITKKLNENQDIQLNYSRRIRRPRFWEVNPFIDINDPLNIRQGNPALRPEYTNSLEFNYFNQYKSGSFLGVLYFKNNQGDITSYSDTITTDVYKQLINAGVSPNAILNTFINAGYTNRMGAEFTVTKKFFDNLEFTYNLDLQYRQTSAKVNDLDLSNSGFYWDTKLITNYKIVTPQKSLFNNLSFQLIADYEAPRVIPQGKTKQQFVSDFAMRKEFLRNKKAAISFNINDIFNTRRWGTIYDTEDFYQDAYRRWDVRTFRITFSYKFGNGDFDIFKKRNNNGGANDDEG
ncbi:outer membrane beta-barrel protein [Ilyomonas limi]|nr:outer membrane beta-barrel protein [Ilyomonas limi]